MPFARRPVNPRARGPKVPWAGAGSGKASDEPAHSRNSRRRNDENQEARPNASHSGVWCCPSLTRRAGPAGAGPALADPSLRSGRALKVGATLKMGHHRMFQLSKLETADEAVSRLLESAEYPRLFAGSNSPRPWWSSSPTLTHPIRERSMWMTGNGVSGSG